MNEKDYVQIYKDLGIQVEPVGKNYTPETFAKNIMRKLNNSKGVTYSSSSNAKIESIIK